MVSIREEELLTFGQAARRLPQRRNGKPLHPNTIWRWAKRGLKSADGKVVKLETTKVGGTNCTSVEALQRFFDELNGDERARRTTNASKSRRAKTAAAKLEKLGI